MTMTKGYGILNHTFKEYLPIEDINSTERKVGVLVATEAGKATAYALGQLEDRGVMFIEPGTEVYEGMIVGECNRENDLCLLYTSILVIICLILLLSAVKIKLKIYLLVDII